MAEAISLEMGAPMDWATDVQTGSGQTHLEDFILRLKDFEFDEHFDQKSNNHIYYKPMEFVDNYPMELANKPNSSQSSSCLCNRMHNDLKPSEIAPLSGMLFAEMIDEVGFPKGYLIW
ncbi:MAG: hypothetical protein CM1200mP13_13960 [Candidatus Pelagibacterales bacterium]|nr:MAG: hypothetical protein CM1200mP13_13960 [Pelagibacterales bacterium]